MDSDEYGRVWHSSTRGVLGEDRQDSDEGGVDRFRKGVQVSEPMGGHAVQGRPMYRGTHICRFIGYDENLNDSTTTSGHGCISCVVLRVWSLLHLCEDSARKLLLVRSIERSAPSYIISGTKAPAQQWPRKLRDIVTPRRHRAHDATRSTRSRRSRTIQGRSSAASPWSSRSSWVVGGWGSPATLEEQSVGAELNGSRRRCRWETPSRTKRLISCANRQVVTGGVLPRGELRCMAHSVEFCGATAA